MMLTVPEAARRADLDPETIRRWIRAGRLPARKVGAQYVIDDADLAGRLAVEISALCAGRGDWSVARAEALANQAALVALLRATPHRLRQLDEEVSPCRA